MRLARGSSRGAPRAALLWLLLLIAAAPDAAAQELPLKSKAAVLIEYQSGRVLYEHNAHTPLPLASVTKVMTLALALEAVRDGKASLDELVTTSEYAASMGGTQIWLEPGEKMPFGELLYALAVGSANDAAVALAEHLAGSEPAFVEAMNAKAKSLGMVNTTFANPSGLPPESVGKPGPHAASAYDIAILSRYSLGLPLFLEIVSTWGPVVMRSETIKQPVLWNYNRMLRTYPGMDGIKTGMTSEAGYCIAATAERDGVRLIVVTLGAPTGADRESDVRRLFDYGFSLLKSVPIAAKGEVVAEVEVLKGVRRTVELEAAAPLAVTLPKESQAEPATEVRLLRDLHAPVAAGETVGELVAFVDGEEAGRVPLVARSAVERASALQLIARYFLQIVQIQG